MASDDIEILKALLTPTILALGYELWGCKLQSRHRRACIYIDNDHGITLSDCERVSRQASAVLKAEDSWIAAYTLEVSSPGLDRPLFTIEQYRRFIGSIIRIRMHTPIENQRNVTGRLQAVLEASIQIRQADQTLVLKWDTIADANLLSEI